MGLLEFGTDEVADLFAVYWLAGHTDHHGFHHRTHLFQRSSACFLNDRSTTEESCSGERA